jgi:quinol-cytochrome oxidoreductase complex cytochrome b subunit
MKDLFLDIKFYLPFMLKTIGEAMSYLTLIIGIFVYMIGFNIILTLAGASAAFATAFPPILLVVAFFWFFRDRRR